MTKQGYPTDHITEQPKKIFYIERLKILLTVLVILHHTFITYGAPGGWYYMQKTTKLAALVPMTIFVSVNQAFFMGFFFFLSAFFIRPSYNRKGAARFVIDRLLRLGIPLVFYSLILSPALSYLVYYFGQENHITFLQYLTGFDDWIDFGVLWFVAALLLFTFIYVLYRKIPQRQPTRIWTTPTAGAILLGAAIVGLTSFLVRIIFPVGWVWKPLGFQLGHFPQYITLFILGLTASKNNWLAALSYRTGKTLGLTALLLLFFFPLFYLIGKMSSMPAQGFSGGLHWQSLLYAVWEQAIGFSIIIALLCAGRKYWNNPLVSFTGKLSRITFAVYIFHPLVVISLSLGVRNWAADPSVKLLLVAPLAVIGSFFLASLITKIPGVRKIV